LDYRQMSDPVQFATNSAQSRLAGVQWRRYGYSSLLVLLATVLGLPFRSFIEPTNLVMLYLAAVMWIAMHWGRNPAIWASILCTILFDLIFVPPYYTFIVEDAQYMLTFLGLLAAGIVISTLVARVREQEKRARRRERQTAVLYDLSQRLTAATADIQQIADVAVNQVAELTASPAAIFLPHNGSLRAWATMTALPTTDESETVTWVYENGQPAGRFTGYDSGRQQGHYLPLTAAQGVMGVLGIYPPDQETWTDEERRLLLSFTGPIGLALARAQLAEETKQMQLMRETEKLHTTLLNSISHDLRTPLASITGVLSSLREDALLLPEAAREELLNTAWEETERLNRLVGNLLDMTRLEAGTMQVARQPADLEDLLGVALKQVASRIKDRPIHTMSLPATLPLVRIDFVLMVQVLVNVLDNAVKYSPVGTAIWIDLHEEPREIVIRISDEGIGVPTEEMDKLFEKFYRVKRRHNLVGTGLGLSICKGIVDLHHGRIWAETRPGGGLAVSIALPKDVTTPVEEANHEPQR
jgi:two-component system, OmpR family, sensor histidine kinase KdpD